MTDYEEYNDQFGSTGYPKNMTQQEIDYSMKLPVKNHIKKLDNTLEELLKDLEQSKRDLQNVRNDIVSIGHLSNESGSEVSRYVMDETLRIAKEFRKLTLIESDETTYLKNQVQNLVQDRIRLQQNTLVLENRVNETEKDVGFKKMYDF
ncbi:hypothetical protein PPERSA_01517 [Pseudocohnilembus persalinus]|uniref:Uncharacterized protein n=1 Tax=Pseudocohnilembus persalinus TaxID=266149 RepID=A0A0V0R7P8_PSEPJ|nr:hypothetical protein PPERSA_01517 [Pseudocohnilembus persalinus]|eukprot:KRX10505.1 hypothetical protein PPERSA_01517 [Pseudocohnilembus persalinus]